MCHSNEYTSTKLLRTQAKYNVSTEIYLQDVLLKKMGCSSRTFHIFTAKCWSSFASTANSKHSFTWACTGIEIL